MDTATILEIVKMIDSRIDAHILKLANKGIIMVTPKEKALVELRDSLLEIIEVEDGVNKLIKAIDQHETNETVKAMLESGDLDDLKEGGTNGK